LYELAGGKSPASPVEEGGLWVILSPFRAPLGGGEPCCEAQSEEEHRAESDERKPLALPALIDKGAELAKAGRAAGM